jgi:hypothetical protein
MSEPITGDAEKDAQIDRLLHQLAELIGCPHHLLVYDPRRNHFGTVSTFEPRQRRLLAFGLERAAQRVSSHVRHCPCHRLNAVCICEPEGERLQLPIDPVSMGELAELLRTWPKRGT